MDKIRTGWQREFFKHRMRSMTGVISLDTPKRFLSISVVVPTTKAGLFYIRAYSRRCGIFPKHGAACHRNVDGNGFANQGSTL
jgi:hypothetical protein